MWTALPLFVPFMGPGGSSYHYGRRFLHLGAVTTQGSLAKSFIVIVSVLIKVGSV